MPPHKRPSRGHSLAEMLVAITIAFFALAVLLVRACDSIIGPDEPENGPRA